MKFTQERKDHIRRIALEKWFGKRMIGRKMPEDQKKKIRDKLKWKPFTGTHCNWVWRKHTEEAKQKMSKAAKWKVISEVTRKKISDKLKWDKSYLWKWWLTEKNHHLRHCIEYREWRLSVFRRDKFICQECKRSWKWIVLNADHILPFSKYPEHRFELSNWRTLCVECHRKTDTYGGKSLKVILGLRL